MSEIKIPPVGESITSGLLADWLVEDGAFVSRGDALFSLETDKISNEIEATEDGVIKILVEAGEEVAIGTVVGEIDESAAPPAKEEAPAEEKSEPAPEPAAAEKKEEAPKPAPKPAPKKTSPPKEPVDPESRMTRKKMSPLRKKIANHLVSAQQNAALLTTFNECDMGEVMTLRKQVQESFVEKNGIKLGFMSIFVKAVVHALKAVPQVNTQIDGDYLIQNHFYDIGVAVGTEKGLVVPVIRDCDQKSFAEIEQDIADYAGKAREGKLDLSDLQGGVFTISNGGIYGSMLSTPILNPPQSGILGMHNIQQRAVVVDGEIVARPMMYLALSYDHRVIDGKEAVTFLVKLKDGIENPARLLAAG